MSTGRQVEAVGRNSKSRLLEFLCRRDKGPPRINTAQNPEKFDPA